MKKICFPLVFILTVLFVCAPVSHAMVMVGSFEGQVTSTNAHKTGITALGSLGINAGDTVLGYFQYDAALATDTLADPAIGQYRFDPAAPLNYLHVTIGSHTWISGDAFNVDIYNDHSGSLDKLAFWSNALFQFPGALTVESIEQAGFSFFQTGSPPTFLQSDALPDQTLTFPASLNPVGGALWTVYSGPEYPDGIPDDWFINFSIDLEKTTLAAVPEPLTAFLVGIGLIAMAGLRRKV